MSGGPVLVVGYGSTLRGDDAVGWRAAELLGADPRLPGVEVLARQQLTPELAEDLSRAALVVLVDAREQPGAAGAVSVGRVAPARGRAPWSHRLDPAALLALCAELYGPPPPVFLVSVGAASFGAGEPLSPPVRRALPEVADAVAGIIKEQLGGPGGSRSEAVAPRRTGGPGGSRSEAVAPRRTGGPGGSRSEAVAPRSQEHRRA